MKYVIAVFAHESRLTRLQCLSLSFVAPWVSPAQWSITIHGKTPGFPADIDVLTCSTTLDLINVNSALAGLLPILNRLWRHMMIFVKYADMVKYLRPQPRPSSPLTLQYLRICIKIPAFLLRALLNA
jgi:hypothetical protein